MTIEWQRDNADGSVWSATIEDGQEGWFEIQVERASGGGGWRWVINHDGASRGQESTLERAQRAVATHLEHTSQRLPRCEIRPFTEEEGGGYMITFPDLPGVVASGARPEEAIRHGRDALEVYRRTATELERASERPVPLISTDAPPRRQ